MSYQAEYWTARRQQKSKVYRQMFSEDFDFSLSTKMQLYICAMYGADMLHLIFENREPEKARRFSKMNHDFIRHAEKKGYLLRWSGERCRYEIKERGRRKGVVGT